MNRYISIVLLFILISAPILFLPAKTNAIISTAGGGGGGFTFNPCADPTSCAIIIGIQVFLALFGSKITCLLGSETGFGDMVMGGLAGVSSSFVKEDVARAKDFVRRLNSQNKNFGGRILQATECKCKGDGLLQGLYGKKEVFLVGDPFPAAIAPVANSKIYDYKSLQQGNFVIGQVTMEKVCKNPTAYGIKYVGTSR